MASWQQGPVLDALGEALDDERVHSVLVLSLRDAFLRRRFQALREQGLTVEAAFLCLADEFALSPERCKSIAYSRPRPTG